MTLPIKHYDGQPITENGLYANIPIEEYHHNPDLCDGPSISSSGLRAFEKCPEKYWHHSTLNPERAEPEAKQHFSFGKVAHALIVEGEIPQDVHVSPYDAFRTNEAKAWRDDVLASGGTVIKEQDLEVIEAMAARLSREPMVKSGLLQGLIEHSLIWKDETTGLWVRSRPDAIPVQDSVLSDYKTSTSADPDDIRRDIAKYGYAQQMALAAEGIARVLGQTIDTFALVVQEKIAPYAVTVASIDLETIRWAARLNRFALDRFAHALKENDWPSYSPGSVTIGFPAWFEKRLEANDKIIPEIETLEEMASHA